MNSQLPKSIRDALAREAPSGQHPSPDLLTAFVESALSSSEKQRITEHLALCAGCRDVVFLSSSLEQEAAEMAGSRITREESEPSLVEAKRKKDWRIGWALPVAAAVLLVGGLFLRQRLALKQPTPEMAAKATPNVPEPLPPEPQTGVAAGTASVAPTTKPTHETRATPTHEKNVPKNAETLALGPVQARAPETAGTIGGILAAPLPAVANAPPTNADSATNQAAAPAAQPQNTLASGEVNRMLAKSATSNHLITTPGAFSRAFVPPRQLWRVTAEGHLEHFIQGSWTRMLADQETAFRVVAISDGDVWAGGSGGALFRSGDGGQSWSKVPVKTSNGSTETDAIVFIRFDDLEHGVLMTENGSRFSTTDGGTTWTSQ